MSNSVQRYGREEAARRIAAMERNTATDCAEFTDQITPPVSIADDDMQEMAAAWRLVRLCLQNDWAGLEAALDDVERSGRLIGVALCLDGMAAGGVVIQAAIKGDAPIRRQPTKPVQNVRMVAIDDTPDHDGD